MTNKNEIQELESYIVITEEYIKYFKSKFSEFVLNLIKEVENEQDFIIFSKYTSKCVQEKKKLVELFINEKNPKLCKMMLISPKATFSLPTYLLYKSSSIDDTNTLENTLYDLIKCKNNDIVNTIKTISV